MVTQTDKKLDPRLRRLVQSSDDSERLRRDVSRGVAVLPAGAASPQPSADTVRTRALVLLSSDRAPDSVKHFQWSRITEGIYAVEVPVSDLETLARTPGVQFVEAARELSPMLVSSVSETRANLVHNPP